MGGHKYNYHNPNKLESSTSPEEGCCSLHCLKFSLYIYNIVFLLAGLAVLGVGVWTIIDRQQYLTLLLNSGVYDVTALYLLLGVGVLMVLVTVLGCCGISRESRCQVLTYSLLLIGILLAEAGASVAAYVYRQHVHAELTNVLVTTFTKEYGLDNQTTAAVDNMQQTLKCCGARAFDQDWENSSWWNTRGAGKVPDSCCKTVSPHCGTRDHPSNIYYTGCAHQIGNIVADHLLLIGSVAVGVCAFEVLGVVLAFLLFAKLRNIGP